MPKQRKPKLIPLKELRTLCKEAGVEIKVHASWSDGEGSWVVERDDEFVGRAEVYGEYKRICRQNLKAFCLGLIAMRKAGEL